MPGRVTDLLDREAELAALTGRIVELAREGRGGSLLIQGPPGIGKSALLERALAGVATPVLRARGSELESTLAFGAVRQMLVPALRRLDDASRREILDGPAQLAGRVLGLAAEGGDEDEALADPLFSLHWLLEELANGEPLILAVDDLHWLDEESGRFVGYLGRRLEAAPILLLATARPDEPGATTPVATLAEVGEVILPGPLSPAAIGALVAGRDPEAAHRATGGNPLMATQLAQAPAEVPLEEVTLSGVGDMVLARVERVSDAATQFAQAVSLFPEGATLEDAATVAGLDVPAAVAVADRLMAAQVLTGEETLTFLHPVMRRSVYDRIGTFERRAGHGAAARVLRERGAPVEAVAAQLLSGAPEGDVENVRVLRRAAARALHSAAPRAAIRYLERAVQEPVPAGRGRFDVLLELGQLQARVGRTDSIETLRDATDAARDPRQFAEASIHLAAVQLAHYEVRDAFTVLEALRGRAELDQEETLYVDALLAASAIELERPEVLHEVVGRMPRGLPGDTPAQRLALFWRWQIDVGQGMDPASMLEELLRCVADDGSVVFSEYGLTTFDPVPGLTMLGAFDVLEQLAEERMAAARERGDQTQYVTGLAARGASLQMRGHWLAAEADFRRALESPTLTDDQRVQVLDQLVEVLARQLRITEAQEAVAQMVALDASAVRVELRHAVIADGSGEPSPHIEHFKSFADHMCRMGLTYPPQRRWLCSYADGLIRNGRHDEARVVIEEYLRDAEPTGDPAAIGSALTVLGKLERGERAIEVLERAVAVLGPSPHEWLRGWAQLELGAALRRENRRVDSREHLKRALAYADEHGEAMIAQRAREELKLAGGRTREASARDRDALTPAEERVARLAAQGYANKAIAAELFLTVGSVKTTMIRVYRKLGINSRSDLPGALGAQAA